MSNEKQLDECVRACLQEYFENLKDVSPDGMHDMLVRAVERPLLEVVLEHADNNQSRAAQWLGLNRNTLRKKLLEHQIIA
jgi:Fis family transcriptional regulator, factor for inversion stimulation protein